MFQIKKLFKRIDCFMVLVEFNCHVTVDNRQEELFGLRIFDSKKDFLKQKEEYLKNLKEYNGKNYPSKIVLYYDDNDDEVIINNYRSNIDTAFTILSARKDVINDVMKFNIQKGSFPF